MLRFLSKFRFYWKTASNQVEKPIQPKNTLDFSQLNHQTKVPQTPIPTAFPDTTKSQIQIDTKTIQLLERLSLVDLDSAEALATLKSSIQFADKIANINTENVRPLYTVLEAQQLQLRNDEVTAGDCRAEVLRNAKVTDEDYFVSPPGNIPLEQEEQLKH